MAKLQIHVFKEDVPDPGEDFTYSKFRVGKTDKVIFHNRQQGENLEVTIKSDVSGGTAALCEKDGTTEVHSFTLPYQDAKNETQYRKAYYVCDGYQADSFKYTAKIDNSTAEDPIVIIGKDIEVDPVLFIAAAGAVVGIAATLVVQSIVRRTSRAVASRQG